MRNKNAVGERSADVDLGFVDLNTANEEELAQIPWIGPDRARALMEHRPFSKMTDVLRVPGFTDEDLEQLIRGGAQVGKAAPVS